jgi:hypothetical protein
MTFPSNAAEEVLMALRTGQVDGNSLLEALAQADLWVPLPAGASDGEGTLPIMVIEDAAYVAVYTSEEQFRRGAGNMGYAVTPGGDFARSLSPELGLAVNPGGDVGLPIHAAAMSVIRGEGSTVPSGTHIRLGEPAEEPLQLFNALRTAFATIREITSARRAWGVIGDEDDGSLILGIALSNDDQKSRKSALDAVDAALRGAFVPYGVDSVFLDDPADPLVAWLLEKTNPFYTRPAE